MMDCRVMGHSRYVGGGGILLLCIIACLPLPHHSSRNTRPLCEPRLCFQTGSSPSRPSGDSLSGCVREDKECVRCWQKPLWSLIARVSCWELQKCYVSFARYEKRAEIRSTDFPLKMTGWEFCKAHALASCCGRVFINNYSQMEFLWEWCNFKF